jgi:ribose transport system ATP-binding protein
LSDVIEVRTEDGGGGVVETVLQVEQLTKRYGATTALDQVTFAVTKGTTHAIIGENGAGKSTLIKSLSGLQVPDAGTMSLDGKLFAPGNLGESRRSGVSTAFQDLSLLSNLTVAENLSLPKLGRRRSAGRVRPAHTLTSTEGRRALAR